jgi:glutaredoxin 2
MNQERRDGFKSLIVNIGQKQEPWLHPYDNDNLGRTIDTINHYSEGAASLKDKNWKNAEIEQFRKEKRELYNDIPQRYISYNKL